MFKFLLVVLVIALAAGEAWLLWSGERVTYWKGSAAVGEQVAALGYNYAEYDMLVCRQFDGKRLITALYRYNEDGLHGGYARCPWRVDPDGQALWPSA